MGGETDFIPLVMWSVLNFARQHLSFCKEDSFPRQPRAGSWAGQRRKPDSLPDGGGGARCGMRVRDASDTRKEQRATTAVFCFVFVFVGNSGGNIPWTAAASPQLAWLSRRLPAFQVFPLSCFTS